MDAFLSHDWAGVVIALGVGLMGWALLRVGREVSFPRRVGRLVLRGAGLLVLGLAALLEVGAISHVVAVARRSARFPAPGVMVDVGGYRLHLLAEGPSNGNPTVVWVSGGHDQGSMMYHLHTRIAAETRSILYDRAGCGWSDVGPYPRSVEREVEELRALLSGAGEAGPFLLAGHSFGGLLAANFTHLHPELVAGVLLMDATPPWNMTFAASTLAPIDSLMRSMTFSLLFGLEWRYPAPLEPGWTVTPDYQGELLAAIRSNDLRVRYWRSFGSALEDPVRRPFSMVIGTGALGDVPLVLITPHHDKEELRTQLVQAGFDLSDVEYENLWDGLVQANAQQVGLSTRGEHHLAPEGTDHNFPYEAPEFTLTEVRGLMAEIRAGGDTAPGAGAPPSDPGAPAE